MKLKWSSFLFMMVLIFLFLFLGNFFVWKNWVEAVQSFITATVKISVCGNGVIEGGEDCEGADLGGQTCESLGYGPGTLTCDIACSFDTTQCSPPPTPTPTPIPTLTSTPTPTPTLIPAFTPTPTFSLLPTSSSLVQETVFTPTAVLTPLPSPTPTPVLPSPLFVFDVDGSGRIERGEFVFAVKKWVGQWQEFLTRKIVSSEKETITVTRDSLTGCDLNRDQRCNLLDFSILLYYIDR